MKKSPANPIVVPTLTRRWVEEQLVTRRIDLKIVSYLARRFPYEDRDDLLGTVGECLAKWSQRGTLDKYIADDSLTLGVLKGWVRQKVIAQMLHEGREPVCRGYGKRSDVEVEASKILGLPLTTRSKTSIRSDPTAPDTVIVYDANDVAMGREVVEATTPESLVAEAHDRVQALHEGRRYVAATFREAADRYLTIFDAVFVEGASRTEIAAREGCSVQRISQLTTRVRNSVRDGEIIRSDAGHILSLIDADPCSTWTEIKKDLRIDKTRFRRAIAYLQQEALVQEHAGESFSIIR